MSGQDWQFILDCLPVIAVVWSLLGLVVAVMMVVTIIQDSKGK